MLRVLPFHVSASPEVSWSSTIHTHTEFFGLGLDLGHPFAKLQLEAQILDPKPQLMSKLSILDKLAFDRLQTSSANLTKPLGNRTG